MDFLRSAYSGFERAANATVGAYPTASFAILLVLTVLVVVYIAMYYHHHKAKFTPHYGNGASAWRHHVASAGAGGSMDSPVSHHAASVLQCGQGEVLMRQHDASGKLVSSCVDAHTAILGDDTVSSSCAGSWDPLATEEAQLFKFTSGGAEADPGQHQAAAPLSDEHLNHVMHGTM